MNKSFVQTSYRTKPQAGCWIPMSLTEAAKHSWDLRNVACPAAVLGERIGAWEGHVKGGYNLVISD